MAYFVKICKNLQIIRPNTIKILCLHNCPILYNFLENKKAQLTQREARDSLGI